MNLKEYLVKENKINLNQKELIAFGIEDYSKGWRERYSNLEITEAMSRKSRSRKKVKKIKTSKIMMNNTTFSNENKFLYLMENQIGNLKIGISSNPDKRAKQLSSSSGLVVKCVAVWELGADAKTVESYLHNVYKKSRLLGEWFTSDRVSVPDIEKHIKCSFTRIL